MYCCDFKTYLSQCYGVESFPLDYAVHLTLVTSSWSAFAPHEQCWPETGELMPDFFKFDKSDFHCQRLAPIVDPVYEDTVCTAPEGLLAKYESGKYADKCSNSFCCDDAIVFSLA